MHMQSHILLSFQLYLKWVESVNVNGFVYYLVFIKMAINNIYSK